MRIQDDGLDMLRSVILANRKRIIDFDAWQEAYTKTNKLDAVVILNIERLPSKCESVK